MVFLWLATSACCCWQDQNGWGTEQGKTLLPPAPALHVVKSHLSTGERSTSAPEFQLLLQPSPLLSLLWGSTSLMSSTPLVTSYFKMSLRAFHEPGIRHHWSSVVSKVGVPWQHCSSHRAQEDLQSTKRFTLMGIWGPRVAPELCCTARRARTGHRWEQG